MSQSGRAWPIGASAARTRWTRRSLLTFLAATGLPVERGKGAVFGSDLQRFPDPATELDVFRLSSPAYSAYLPAYYGRVLSHKGSGFARDYQAAWQRGSGLGSIVGAGRVEPPVQPRSTPGGLRTGQSVFHNKFGEGVIVTLEGSGEDARAQVNFGRHGMKWLALSVAKLTPVN